MVLEWLNNLKENGKKKNGEYQLVHANAGAVVDDSQARKTAPMTPENRQVNNHR